MVVRVLAVLAASLLVAAGCAGAGGDGRDVEPYRSAQKPTPVSTASSPPSDATEVVTDPNDPVVLADGVVLEPGADGRLPVRVRWTYQGAAPEMFAVDRPRGLLYLDDELATALDLVDGSVVWQVGAPSDSYLDGGLASDGGDVIGRSGPDRVRFFAPFNFDLTVDPATGSRIAFQHASDEPRGVLRPFAQPRPRDPRIALGLSGATARAQDGRVLWRVRVQEPMFDERGPVAVPGGVAFLLSTGLLVVLDWAQS